MTIFGVGPKIMFSTFGYLAVVGIATYLWPDLLLVHAAPYGFFLVPGVVLLTIGLPMLIVAVISVKGAYKKDELATTGMFAIVRNPIHLAERFGQAYLEYKARIPELFRWPRMGHKT